MSMTFSKILTTLALFLALIGGAEAQQAGGGFDFMQFLPLVLIFVVFYFLLLRPQQKKMKTHKAMLENLRRGDKIVTNGGLVGVVTKIVSDREVQLEIADGVKVRVFRPMISDLLAKTEPVEGDVAPLTTAVDEEKAIKKTGSKKTGVRKTSSKKSSSK